MIIYNDAVVRNLFDAVQVVREQMGDTLADFMASEINSIIYEYEKDKENKECDAVYEAERHASDLLLEIQDWATAGKQHLAGRLSAKDKEYVWKCLNEIDKICHENT